MCRLVVVADLTGCYITRSPESTVVFFLKLSVVRLFWGIKVEDVGSAPSPLMRFSIIDDIMKLGVLLLINKCK